MIFFFFWIRDMLELILKKEYILVGPRLLPFENIGQRIIRTSYIYIYIYIYKSANAPIVCCHYASNVFHCSSTVQFWWVPLFCLFVKPKRFVWLKCENQIKKKRKRRQTKRARGLESSGIWNSLCLSTSIFLSFSISREFLEWESKPWLPMAFFGRLWWYIGRSKYSKGGWVDQSEGRLWVERYDLLLSSFLLLYTLLLFLSFFLSFFQIFDMCYG